MSVRVLFFGATADIAGTRALDLPVEEDLKADRFLKKMIDRFPALASHRLHLSINQQYVSDDETIRKGDEVALFTAVSGG
jgi:molybdopterin converting factor small subunit